MYFEQIEKLKGAIEVGRYDVAQMILSTILLMPNGDLNEDAKKEILAAIPGSKIIFGGGVGGLRAGYLLVDGSRFYFA